MLSPELSKSVDIALAGLRALDVKSAAALSAKVARAKKDLASTTQKLEKANSELEAAEAALAKLQARNKQDCDNEIAAAKAQLEEAWIDQERANHKLGDLDAAIRDKRAVHDGLVHAMAQLVDRLEGKKDHDGLIARLANQAPNN